MRLHADAVRVTVPATSGNLGPGFDALGMAIDLRDELEVKLIAADTISLNITGAGAESLPRDDSHLVVRAIRAALDFVGASHGGLEITAHNRIPHARGLGSSAAAVVAGITAVKGMISEPAVLDHAAVLQLATKFEGHPDNAAPAIWGGATVAWIDEVGLPHATALTLAPDLESAVLIPAVGLTTNQARAVLPLQIPHRDAAFNVGRAALLVHALRERPELLFSATADRMHQDYRADVMPPALAMVRLLREQGIAAVVSGAGPAVLVLGTDLTAAGFGAGPLPQYAGVGDQDWYAVLTQSSVAGATFERL